MVEKRTLKVRNIIAYGLGDIYGGGSFFVVSTFSMYYLITVVGLSPLLAGLVPGLGKVWDAFSDPLMGYISDNTRSRRGRRRVFFLVAVVPILVSFTLIWVPAPFSSQISLFLYYFIVYLFFYTVFTMTMVPYSALSAEMTTDFKERNSLTGARMIFSILGTLIGAAAVQPIIDSFQDPGRGHLVMGVIFGVLYALPWLLVYAGTWELPVKEKTEPVHFLKNFVSIFANRTFRIHILMYIFSYTTLDILMGWFKFYFIDYMGRQDLISTGMLVLVLAELACIPLYVAVSNRAGHARAYLAGLVIAAAGIGLMYFQGPSSSTPLLLVNCALIGAGMSAGILIPWTVLPFLADVDELITTQKRAGTYAGSMTLIRKLIQGALVIPLIGVLLTAIGYRTLEPADHALLKAVRAAGEMAGKASGERITGEEERRLADLGDRVLRSARLLADTDKRGRVEPLAAAMKADIDAALGESAAEDRAAGFSRASEGARRTAAAMEVKQDESAVRYLKLLFIFMPLGLLACGIAASGFFRLNPRTHALMMKEIERLAAGGGRSDADPETKRVCEMLSGKPHNRLYRKPEGRRK